MILSVHRKHIHIVWMWEWVLDEASTLTLTDV